MAETIDIKLTLDGAVPETLHIHLTLSDDLAGILDQLNTIGTTMSDMSNAMTGLTTAIGDASARVDEDVAHLNDLLEQALAADTADADTIAQLRADAADTVTRLGEATTSLTSINPLTDFPAAEPPAEGQPPPNA